MPIFEEDYRYYPLMKPIIVNGYEFNEMVIKPHYEEKHKYLTDEDILNIAKKLDAKTFDIHRKGVTEDGYK